MRVTDYQVAKVVLLTFANSGERHIAPMGYYDDDADLVGEIQNKCGLEKVSCKAFSQRLFRVCNKLCHIGIFFGETRGTHKEYFGEPTKQREFRWTNPSYLLRLKPDYRYLPQMEPNPQLELDFLLRHFPGAPGKCRSLSHDRKSA